MTKTVTVLGTGIMGTGMARSLLRHGFTVRVWNRTAQKAQHLADDGASVSADAATAVAGADVVVTMLFDVDAVAEVMRQALPAMAPDAIWLQTSTVGVEATLQLAELAEGYGVGFLDAPVLGTRQPAEEGKLVPLVGGASRLREAVTPVLDAIGARTIWVGERPGDGHRLKLVANSWVLSVVGATAQAIALAQRLDIDPQLFLDAIAGGALDSQYAQVKGRAMIAGEFPPAFPVAGAVKDSGLIAEAMRTVGVEDGLMTALHGAFRAAADAGHDAADMAAVVHAFRGGPAATQ